MLHKETVIIVLLLFISQSLSLDYREDNNVLVLTETNFDEAIKDFSHLLVQFCVPSARGCSRAEYEYSRAAKTLRDEGSAVKIAKVDVSKEIALARRFSIRAYPTYLKFEDRVSKEFNEGNRGSAIIQWARDTNVTWVKYIEEVADFEKILEERDVIIAFWDDNTTFDYMNFESTASSVQDVAFVAVSRQVEEKYLPSNAGRIKITLFTKHQEQQQFDFTDFIHRTSLTKFINENKGPLITKFDPESSRKFFYGREPTLILIISDDQESEDANEAFKRAAQQLRGKALMTFTNADSEEGQSLLEGLGVSQERLPLLAIISPSSDGPIKYVLDDSDIAMGTILEFYHNFADGRVSPFYKSEPIPKEIASDNVKTIMGKNYKDIVLNENKDVFIMYHASWCRACDQISQVWRALAGTAKSDEKLVIGTFDISANEVQGLDIHSVPRFIFYPRGDKTNPKIFTGRRTPEVFWEFIQANQAKEDIPIPENVTPEESVKQSDELKVKQSNELKSDKSRSRGPRRPNKKVYKDVDL